MKCELSGQLAQVRGIFHSTLIVAPVRDEHREFHRIQIAGAKPGFIGRLHGLVIAARRPEYFRGEAQRQCEPIVILPSDYL
jgi:hypothetical protein